ncbi:MAG: thiamine pyrophosphate-binding protein [Polyangiaceae bacterium]
MQTDILSSRHAAVRHNTASALLSTFAHRGVTRAFGIPGGLVSPVFDALRAEPRIRLLSARHETMAGYAAMGHAVVTGTPALVVVTGGPGLTNAITAVAAAYLEGLPLIVIAGDVPSSASGRMALQDSSTSGIDTVAMLRTVTRWSARVDGPAAAIGIAEQALRIACGERPGPVFLSLPLDVGNQTTVPCPIALDCALGPAEPDQAACKEVAERLLCARRPLLVLGNGARGAAAELRHLAERLACPVVTTPHAKGVFPESHRLHLGGLGIGGHPSVDEYLHAPPDVVCIVGSRLGDYATNGWAQRLTGTDATYQIDREPLFIGRNYPVTLGIVADSARAVATITSHLPQDVATPVRDFRGVRRHDESALVDDSVPLRPARILRALQEAFPDAFWTVDQGEHCAYALHYLQVDHPDELRTLVGFAAMGSGIGLALGAASTQRGRPVIALCGDGGFVMHAGEILSAVEQGLELVLVVMNDGRWNMVHHGFQAVFGRRPDALPSKVSDIAGVAESFGARGVAIESPEQLRPEYLRALRTPGRPLLLDVRFDSSTALSTLSRSASLRDFAERGA